MCLIVIADNVAMQVNCFPNQILCSLINLHLSCYVSIPYCVCERERVCGWVRAVSNHV